MSISPELKSQILEYIKQPIPQNEDITLVESSIPILFFGNIEKASVATVSINPSFGEFKKNGKLLSIKEKRFTDRELLGVKDTERLNDYQAERVYKSLKDYFTHKKIYDNWFKKVNDRIKNLIDVSYYEGTMVNLDIYPWATEKIWGELNNKKAKEAKSAALKSYRKTNILKNILLHKNFEYVYINGATVYEEMKQYFEDMIREHSVDVSGETWKIYEGKLDNGTKLIGLNCYIPSTPIKTKTLLYLFDILKQYM